MDYTVKELAELAGVSVRTLHWYDEIGLLLPAHVTAAGYRIYGPREVDLLQHILFYRALNVPVKQIKTLLHAPTFNTLEALQSHRTALLAQQQTLGALLETLDKTIQSQQEELRMTDKEKFEGFKKKLIDDNEEKYGEEIRAKYGNSEVDASNARMMNLSMEEYNAMQALAAEMNTRLEAAVQAGLDPKGEEGQQIAQMHKNWLGYTWGAKKYSPEAHAGLGQMYVADERFTAYYDKNVAGCAQFICDAIAKFTSKA